MAPLAVKVVEVPEHIVGGEAEIVTVGVAITTTVIVCGELLVHIVPLTE